MTTSLVTGGTGFIGGHLIAQLVKSGRRVRASVRNTEQTAQVAALGAEPVVWALADETVDPKLLAGVDEVFHLAAPRRVYDPRTRQTHRPADAVLRTGTQSLVRAFRESDAARFVLSSSAAVYGKPWGHVDEAGPARPTGEYGRTRLATEAVCQEILQNQPERLVIARLPETFGPGSPGQLGLLTTIAEGNFRLIGHGGTTHHLSTVGDVVRGLIKASDTPAAGGATLNIGSPPESLRAFVAAACDALGQPLRDTPWAEAPARAALGILRASPMLTRASRGLYGVLDYQLRPRVYDGSLARALLGPYQVDDFATVVAESAHWVRRNAGALGDR